MTAPDRARLTSAAIAAGLLALVVWSTWKRYAFLTSSPYPMGIDGYFYPIQLRSILEHGTLQYPQSPLAFYLMAPLAWLTDPITGAKLGGAIGGALIALPAYAVGARLGGNRAAGIAAAVIATTSAGSWYLSVEFIKNGWGLTAALTAVWLILRAVEGPTWRRIGVAAGAVVAAALTHKMALALVVVIGGPAIAVELIRRRTALPRATVIRDAKITGGVVAGAVGIAVALALLAPERFLAARDLLQLGDLFSRVAHWDAPALWLDGGKFQLPMGHEAQAAGVIALIAAGVLLVPLVVRLPWWPAVDRSPPVIAAGLGAIALALFVALPWLDVGDPQGLGLRLRIAAFVPLALVAAIVVGQLAAVVAPALAEVPRARGLAGAVVAAGLALVFVAGAPGERPEGVVRAHPAMVTATMALAGTIAEGDTVVVSERHILFMAAYYTRRPIVLRPEPIAPGRRLRLMPLAFIGRDTSLYRLLLSARKHRPDGPPRGLHPRDPNGLVIVPESTWEWILERLPPTPQRYFREWHTI